MTICSKTIGYCFAIVFNNNKLLFCNLKIPKQGIEMQLFFPKRVEEILKNGHVPVKLHPSTPPPPGIPLIAWADYSPQT